MAGGVPRRLEFFLADSHVQVTVSLSLVPTAPVPAKDFDGDLNMVSFCPELIELLQATQSAVDGAQLETYEQAGVRSSRHQGVNGTPCQSLYCVCSLTMAKAGSPCFYMCGGCCLLSSVLQAVDDALTRAQQESETQPRAPEASGAEFESRSSKDRKREFAIAPAPTFP